MNEHMNAHKCGVTIHHKVLPAICYIEEASKRVLVLQQLSLSLSHNPAIRMSRLQQMLLQQSVRMVALLYCCSTK